MNKILWLLVFVLTGTSLYSQEKDTSYNELDEVIISANRFTEKRKNISQKIDVINSKKITTINAQNTGDLLMNSGNIFVQKSQQGGSSPVIRGFEASRVLLVIDGVRLNNAVYRSGHLQNVITVDQNMLERVEVLYGPASTIYGSDALGGVVHMRTINPTLSNKSVLVKGNGFVRYSSANNEKTGHANVQFGTKKWGFLTSFTYSDFGDMRSGSSRPEKFPLFGRRPDYVQRVNGKDSVFVNPDDRVQKFSGYTQWDLMQKVLYKPKENISHLLNIQLSGSSNIPRYDRLTDRSNGRLRFAEWYYGPQNRTMLAYEFNASKINAFFTEYKAGINYQQIDESRHQRSFGSNNLDNRIEKIDVTAFFFDLRRKTKLHEFNGGIDGQLNQVNSTAFRKNISSGEVSKLDTRYPDGTNRMNYFGVYAQHLFKIKEDRLILNDGIRVQYTDLYSTILDNATQLNLPYSEVSQRNLAVTGNIGLVLLMENDLRYTATLASGFRAPNIDDLSKIFESSTVNRQVIVPNKDIRPEYTYSIDLGINKTWNKKHSVGLNTFYTLFKNAIVTAPFTFNGQDSIEYNGVMSAVLANQNRNRAYVFGLSAKISSMIMENLQVEATANYTYGRFKTDTKNASTIYKKLEDGTYARVTEFVKEKPMDHIPPFFGRAAVRYFKKNWDVEFYSIYNGWKRLDEYNADGEDNAQYATVEGSPGWYTLNLKAQWQFDRVRLQAGMENILDKHYRQFASGFSAAGRNLVLALRVSL